MSIRIDLELLRIVAMLAMLLDHIGAIFDVEYLRVIGRIAFPIFSYILVDNLIRTPEVQEKYLWRLLIFGVISQLPFSIAFQTTMLNIMFQFLGFVVFLKLNRILGLIISSISDYSIFGFLYILTMYNYLNYQHGNRDGLIFPVYTSAFLLNISFFSIVHILVTLVITTILMLFRTVDPTEPSKVTSDSKGISLELIRRGRSLPYYVFYIFYPAHILLIYIAKTYL
ncbi:MAG: TraX family protein [Candidatus Anstonellales archaeon]